MDPEEKIEVATPFGPVWFWRRDTGQPVLLIITGTFADFDTLAQLDWNMVGVDVWRAHLPGNHCPPLAATSIGVFAAAYSHAIRTALKDRDVVVVGLSVGGLVALGLTASNVRQLVVVEPPLLTGDLWPLHSLPQTAPPGQEAFLWEILGLARDRSEPRDYSPLLDRLSLPTRALVGDDPLMPVRSFTSTPSLISAETRALLDRHPLIEVIEAQDVGHNIPRLAQTIFAQTMLDACREVFGPRAKFRPRPADL